MAESFFNKLGSENILSGHVNGLQGAVNNIESILKLNTETASDIDLKAVTDMDDDGLRYRIYEADTRGWVANPSPVIYKNGTEVSEDEYDLYSGHGVIVFHVQQLPDDVITADVTYVTNSSTKLNDMDNSIQTLRQDVDSIDTGTGGDTVTSSELQAVKDDLQTTTDKVNTVDAENNLIINIIGDWLYNNQIGKYYSDTTYKSSVLSGANSIDFFPVIIQSPTELKSVASYTSYANSNTSTNTVFGVYDSLNGKPNKLVAQSDNFSLSGASSSYDMPMTRGQGGASLSSPVVLEKGIYFMARYNSNGVYYRGVSAVRKNAENVLIEITEPDNASARNASGSDFYSGYRLDNSESTPTVDLTALPDVLPEKLNSTFTALARNTIQEMYIVPVAVGV